MAIIVTDVTEGSVLKTSESSTEQFIASEQFFDSVPITKRDLYVAGGVALLFLLFR